MKTHSNGCKPRIAITLSGWNTSPSIRSLIAIAPTIVFKSSSGESTCFELDYEIPEACAECTCRLQLDYLMAQFVVEAFDCTRLTVRGLMQPRCLICCRP